MWPWIGKWALRLTYFQMKRFNNCCKSYYKHDLNRNEGMNSFDVYNEMEANVILFLCLVLTGKDDRNLDVNYRPVNRWIPKNEVKSITYCTLFYYVFGTYLKILWYVNQSYAYLLVKYALKLKWFLSTIYTMPFLFSFPLWSQMYL